MEGNGYRVHGGTSCRFVMQHRQTDGQTDVTIMPIADDTV